MIRVAFYSPLLDVGGTQRHLQQVLRLLDGTRFAIHEVVTLRGGGVVEEALRASGIAVRSLELGARLVSPSGLRLLRAEARRLREGHVDVVQAYQWRPSLVAALVGRMAGVPVVLAGKRSLTGSSRQAQLAWRVIGRLVDTIVTNADALQQEAEGQGVRARWSVLRNGIDVDYFDVSPATAATKRDWGLDPTRPVIGSIGRLEARKGHALLLEARHAMGTASQLPQVLLVGDGPARGALEAQAQQLGIAGDVRFAGEVDDVRSALAAMDVFVLPSHEEGMSNALLEAMAAARPIVATAVGGTPEVVGPDGGVLVPQRDPVALATALGTLLANPAALPELGQAARRRVDARFSARVMIDSLQELYASRLASTGRLAA